MSFSVRIWWSFYKDKGQWESCIHVISIFVASLPRPTSSERPIILSAATFIQGQARDACLSWLTMNVNLMHECLTESPDT